MKFRRRCLLVLVLAAGPASVVHAVPPVVGSVQRLLERGESEQLKAGQALMSELNCLACHPSNPGFKARIGRKPAPDLANAGSRLNPSYVREYLLRIHTLKPGSTMPDLLRIGSGAGRDRDVDHLVHFIASLGGPLNPSRELVTPTMVEQGRRIFHTIGCVACHPSESEARSDKPVDPSLVPLMSMGKKTTMERMIEFLQDPLATRPSGRMPRVPMTLWEARRLSAYLLRNQQTAAEWAEQKKAPGLLFEVYGDPYRPGSTLDLLQPVDAGRIKQIKAGFSQAPKTGPYAVRFSGFLHIETAGSYELELKASGGWATLELADKGLLAYGAGDRKNKKKIDLKPGDHAVRIVYEFRGQGKKELELNWRPPGEEQLVPIKPEALVQWEGRRMNPPGSAFVIDPEQLPIGKRMFGNLGCADCHQLQNIPSKVFAPNLSRNDLDLETGCLAPMPARSLPVFRLSDAQKDAIRAVLRRQEELSKPAAPQEAATVALAKYGCLNCHDRGELGGPVKLRAELFKTTIEADLGEEGKLPPTLTLAGAKLTIEAMRRLLVEGRGSVRPYLATRMPVFGEQNALEIIAALRAADVIEGNDVMPPVNERTVADGHRLVGNKGLGCVNCHGVEGRKSLGIPAVDLSLEAGRLRPGWLRHYLADPAAINKNTRMPPFWLNGAVIFKDVAGGTAEGQMNAIFAYLSLGSAMPLPEGLTASEDQYELAPTTEPIVLRTFSSEAGPRTIDVGFPRRLAVSFDADHLRLAQAWRGKFVDARGIWTGRGGQNTDPLGVEILDLPQGPAVAKLADERQAWPEGKERLPGFGGYRYDDQRRPIFVYQAGGAKIEEQPLPVVGGEGVQLLRRFTIASGEAFGLHLRAAVGRVIEPAGPTAWKIDGKLTVRTASPATVRISGDHRELIVPLNGLKGVELMVEW